MYSAWVCVYGCVCVFKGCVPAEIEISATQLGDVCVQLPSHLKQTVQLTVQADPPPTPPSCVCECVSERERERERGVSWPVFFFSPSYELMIPQLVFVLFIQAYYISDDCNNSRGF